MLENYLIIILYLLAVAIVVWSLIHYSALNQLRHTLEDWLCDFTCPKFGDPDDIVDAIFRSDILYDQIILEFDKWVHLAFPENGKSARKKALIINQKGTMIYSQ